MYVFLIQGILSLVILHAVRLLVFEQICTSTVSSSAKLRLCDFLTRVCYKCVLSYEKAGLQVGAMFACMCLKSYGNVRAQMFTHECAFASGHFHRQCRLGACYDARRCTPVRFQNAELTGRQTTMAFCHGRAITLESPGCTVRLSTTRPVGEQPDTLIVFWSFCRSTIL